MNERFLRALIGDLCDAYPREPMNEGRVKLLLRDLADLPPDTLEQAVRVLMRTSHYFPSVPTIRETVAELALELPSEVDALTQIAARVQWAQRGDEPPPPAVHPLVKEALDHVGGYHAFKTAEKQSIIRGQLLRIYRELRGGAIRTHQVGSIELEAGPQRREIEQ